MIRKIIFIPFLLVIFCASSFAEGFPAVEVYKNNSKAVVLIVAQKDKKSSMIGAGSVISLAGYVVTNAHVVIDKTTSRPFSTIRVFIKPNKVTGDLQRDLVNRYKAKVAAYDNKFDLAVLEVEGLSSDIGLIELADPDEINIGEEVVAIGHPEQGGLWSLTYGRISGQIANQSDVPGKDVYQTDTSVNRGNSGGPLLDRRGYMVGINTNIARLGAGNMPITGVNFAVQSSVVQKWLAGKGLVLAYGQKALYEEAEPINVESRKEPVKEDKIVQEAKPGKEKPSEKTEKKPEVKDKGETKTNFPEEKKITVEERTKPKEKADPQEGLMTKPSAGKKAIEKKKQDLLDEGKMAMTGESEKIPEDKILTPKRPYDIDDLFEEVEKEMEDIMEEMRWKIRKR